MALIKSFTFNGGLSASSAYCMVDMVRNHRLASAVTWQMVVWKDKAMRDSYRTAQADVIAKTATFNALKDQLDAIPKQEDWPADVKLAHQVAAVQLNAAAEVCSKIVPIQNSPEITLGFDKSAAVLTLDPVQKIMVPDIAKIYAYMKANIPEWKDTQDELS